MSSLQQPNIRFRTHSSPSIDLAKQNEAKSTKEWPTKTVHHWQLEIYQTDEGYLIRSLEPTSNPDLSPRHPLTFLPYGGVIELPQSELCLAIIGPSRQMIQGKMPVEEDLPPQTPSGMYFYPKTSQFFVDHQPISPTVLTAIEHDLLKYLYDHPDQVCTYYRIGEAVWKGWVRKATIVKTVSNIRKKLNELCPGAGSRYVRTSRGHKPGYILVNVS